MLKALNKSREYDENCFTMKHEGYTIKAIVDEIPQNPRTEWDNLGTMACWHRRYTLGDKHSYKHPENLYLDLKNANQDSAGYLFKNNQELMDAFYGLKDIICLPLYLFDHSGITMKTTPFSCPWDSGWVGLIYITKAKIREEYGWKVITKERADKIREHLTAEVKTYDQYLTGEVYVYEVFNKDGKEIDSCGGYYGDDFDENGLLEAAVDDIECDMKHVLRDEGVQQELAVA